MFKSNSGGSMAPGEAILLFLERCGGGALCALCTRVSCTLLFVLLGSCSFAGCVEQVPVGGRVGDGPATMNMGPTKRSHACARRVQLEGDWPAWRSGWRRAASQPFQASGEPWGLRRDTERAQLCGDNANQASGGKTLASTAKSLCGTRARVTAFCARSEHQNLSSQKPADRSSS